MVDERGGVLLAGVLMERTRDDSAKFEDTGGRGQMLRLIYGGFGSGKSTRVNSLIREQIKTKDKYKDISLLM